MNPLAVEQIAQNHYENLVQLAQADQAARALQAVRPWRRFVSHALVRVAVDVGLPRTRRPFARREVRALLADDCVC